MNPRRAWIAIVSLALGILLAVWALSTYLEARRPRPEVRFLDVWKIDAHERAGPEALSLAMSLAATQRIRGFVNYAGGHAGDGLEEQVAAASRYPGRVAVFMELDLAGCCGEDWSNREVVRMVQGRAGGARGLSIPGPLGSVRDRSGRRVPVDAPELEPVWEMARRLTIPVSVEIGDGAGPGDGARGPLDEFARVVERYPRLPFLAVHFQGGGRDPEAVSRLLDRFPNLFVDTAACLPELGRRAPAVRTAILNHPDRVLFGTGLEWLDGPQGRKAVVLGAGRPARSVVEIRRFFESTWRFFETADEGIPDPSPVEGPWTLEGLGLPRKVLEGVYHGNAERLFGFGPPEPD